MSDFKELKPPDDIDWHIWLNRHDRMQKRYFVMRDERFELIGRLISETQEHPIRVLDLGCGAGGMMSSILEAIPQAEVIGIDFDPTFLWLSDARLKRFGKRCRLIMTDFLDTSWLKAVGGSLAAVVSAQTFHMLDSGQLAPLYRQIAQILRPGGIFLSADHARSDSPAIQQAWEHMRAEAGAQATEQDSDDWDGFWKAYSLALGVDITEIHERLYGGRRRRKKERLPLAWHLSRMMESGFASADCFWRSEYDAVYGGQRSL
jgi:SAM-dependent methyltransferase